jgi:hypothetical protein
VYLSRFFYITALALFAISCSKNKVNNVVDNPLSITTSAIDTSISKDSLWIKTDPIVWIYDTSGFSTVSIFIKGNTNADSVGIETHGDGLISTYKIKLNSNHAFSDSVSIGFSHVSGEYINYFDTKITLYKTNGDSAEIVVLNPKH